MRMHALLKNKTQTTFYDRATIGRYPACLPMILWSNGIDRPSGDPRPIDARWSGDLWPISLWKFLQNVGRSSSDHRPTLHRWQNQWKSAVRSTKLLTWVLRQKSRQPTKNKPKSVQTPADVTRFSQICSPTVGLGNVTVVLFLNITSLC